MKGGHYHVDKAGWSVLGYEIMQVLGQGVGGLGHDLVEKGVLAEEITDEQVLFAFVVEVVSYNLLPWAVRDIPGEHGLFKGRGFVLGVDSVLADIISYICIDAGPVHCLLPVPASYLSPDGLHAVQQRCS